MVHLLRRGDIDKPVREVEPGAISAINHLPGRFELTDPKNESARRAALADWLIHEDNPLAWRSIVNRVWHYHFGRGLCDTPSDFGRMGSQPSHPELLDYSSNDWNSPGASHRSIYRVVWRGISDPFMEAPDFLDLGLLAPKRGFSVSVIQSLAVFNNDFVLHGREWLEQRVDEMGFLMTMRSKTNVHGPGTSENAAYWHVAYARGQPVSCKSEWAARSGGGSIVQFKQRTPSEKFAKRAGE